MINLKTCINPAKSPASQESQLKLSLDQFLNRKDIGFKDLPFDIEVLLASENMAKEIKNFEHLVLVGIGGSSMGPRALAEISASQKISFLDNVDSIETERVLKNLDLKKTAWLIISKSGTTIEVLWNLELVKLVYQKNNIPFWPNTFYITENTDNPLKQLSLKYQRPFLPIPLNVGGRFSVLSPVGLVVAEYLDLSAKNLLEGAKKALERKDLVLQASLQYLCSFERHEDITLFWFYNSNMRWFGCWLQQLWAESLGKKNKTDGSPAPAFSAPMISIGTCDQHSIMQQVVDGPKNKFVNIFRFNDVENSSFQISETQFKETQILNGLNYGELIKAEAVATEQAFRQSGVSTMLFEISKLNSQSLGFLFMYYQLIVATLGEHCKINAFDQPGVALTKKLTLEQLDQAQKSY